MDEVYGSTKFEISSLPLNQTVQKTFKFNEVGKLHRCLGNSQYFWVYNALLLPKI